MGRGLVDGQWVESVVRRFIASPANIMKNDHEERAWESPIVGYSSGADPLYSFYKRDIGSFYVLPAEFLMNSFPGSEFTSEQVTVVSWVLPHTDMTKADHRKETRWPSERWARNRILGEEVNKNLHRHLVKALTDEGINAVAPSLSPLFRRDVSEKYGFASLSSQAFLCNAC
jgi:epoxyqueuosine reductase